MDHLDAAERSDRQLRRLDVQVAALREARDLAIAAAYEEDDYTTAEIATRLGMGRLTVTKRLRAMGVEIRPRGPRPRRDAAPGGGSGGGVGQDVIA